MVVRRSPPNGFFNAVLTWHTVGAILGAVGLGLGTFAVSLFAPWNPSELVAGTVSMALAGLIVAIVLTPVAFVVLAGWIGVVRFAPILERGSRGYRIAKLSVVALVITVPGALVFVTILGMRAAGETRPAIMVAWSALWKDWPYLLMYVPAAWGWFVLPRLVVPALRAPILSSANSAAGT